MLAWVYYLKDRGASTMSSVQSNCEIKIEVIYGYPYARLGVRQGCKQPLNQLTPAVLNPLHWTASSNQHASHLTVQCEVFTLHFYWHTFHWIAVLNPPASSNQHASHLALHFCLLTFRWIAPASCLICTTHNITLQEYTELSSFYLVSMGNIVQVSTLLTHKLHRAAPKCDIVQWFCKTWYKVSCTVLYILLMPITEL